ncbi:unnamed protein product, partial [marine sediment metagenome]
WVISSREHGYEVHDNQRQHDEREYIAQTFGRLFGTRSLSHTLQDVTSVKRHEWQEVEHPDSEVEQKHPR